MTNIRLYSRILPFGILFVLTSLQIEAKKNNALTSKEDSSDINLAEDLDRSHEKKKRDWPPKLQEKFISILSPAPVNDTITEAEKYGNIGDTFHKSVLERVGDEMNKGIKGPKNAILKVSKSIPDVRNQLRIWFDNIFG